MRNFKHDIDFEDPELISELIKTMIERTPAAYVVLDKHFRVHYANSYFYRLRGASPGAMVGRFCYDAANNGRPCPVCVVRQTWEDGRHHLMMRKDIMPDGSATYLEEHAIPILKGDGAFDFVLEIMIDRTRAMQLRQEAGAMFHNIVRSLVSVLEKKDAYTCTHSNDVSTISTRLARFMGLDEGLVYRISLGALLHDIGKVLIPDTIINKPGGLTDDEYDVIKRHPVESFRLLANLEGFEDIKDICLRHHERWDGRGYPDGLSGRETLLGAHIVSLADTYDAMTSDRSYRRGLPHETAIEEIRRGVGGQFNPEVGEKFIEMGTLYYNSRERMTATDGSVMDDYLQFLHNDGQDRVVRDLSAIEAPGAAGPEELGGEFYFTDELARSIFKHTPAFYSIIDEDMDVLYVSDSMARELNCEVCDLIGRKCYEINEKNTSCLMDGEDLSCPGLRAMNQRVVHRGEVDESWGGDARSFDITAIPIEIEDRHGRPSRYVLEIMFDRTDEVALQRKLNQDIRLVIQTLERLIARIDPAEAGNSEAIIQECGSIGEFLSRFSEELSRKYRGES
ncbi:hypothetical protein C4J81_12995 [Deltaproteobacteria bacterium Smac51]|nr:hypothetical protein C4J81_12995 [Deltaproteobacteria bacterium Smac51]